VSAGEEPVVRRDVAKASTSQFLSLAVPLLPLALWYAYHYARTGFVFGNPEFFRYNVQGTLHPLRILLAALLRIWQAVGYMNLFVLTVACGENHASSSRSQRWRLRFSGWKSSTSSRASGRSIRSTATVGPSHFSPLLFFISAGGGVLRRRRRDSAA